ncbi:MAG TPA: hypothetical protein VK806_09675 [Bacteroidia bacterium]|nr:hypothetical protein [Bacteroidia bacterium]
MKKYFYYIGIALLYCACNSSGGDMNMYHDCGMEGDAKRYDVRALNKLKNRYDFPDSAAIDHTITLESILAPGNDRDRFSPSKAVEITGYVFDVKMGGDESCNCHARAVDERDTHIELVLTPDATEEKQRVIVEVTPRMREIMSKKGIDWSTDNLRRTIKGHQVKVTGWLLFDEEHSKQAENTEPDNDKDWRATCWEIHPITKIEILDKQLSSGPL